MVLKHRRRAVMDLDDDELAGLGRLASHGRRGPGGKAGVDIVADVVARAGEEESEYTRDLSLLQAAAEAPHRRENQRLSNEEMVDKRLELMRAGRAEARADRKVARVVQGMGYADRAWNAVQASTVEQQAPGWERVPGVQIEI